MSIDYAKEQVSRNAAQQRFQQRIVEKDAWQCCLNCEAFKNDVCQRFGNVTPPPAVVVHGCDLWQFRIPF
jgi:hypothetical protein